MNSKNNPQGFVLAPIMLFMFISLIIIIIGSKELHQAVLMHQLKLRKNCADFSNQLNKAGEVRAIQCPPCLAVMGCYHADNS